MDQSNWKTTVLRYVAWIIASLAMAVNIYLIREAMYDVLTRIGAALQSRPSDPSQQGTTSVTFAIEAIDRFVIIALSLAAVGLAVWVEYYLRNGEKRGQLFPRIGKVYLYLIIVTVVALLVQILF